jgi:Tol biopolymer transport system component
MKHNSLLRLTTLLIIGSTGYAQTTALVSADPQSLPGNGRSEAPTVSADGTCVVFQSLATNLTPGISQNYISNIFLRDLQTQQTSWISAPSSGSQPNGLSSLPDVSATGRFVVYGSQASNLTPQDSNGTSDVFRYDRTTGQTSLVSINSFGVQGSAGSGGPSVSMDGTLIAFLSGSDNLAANDQNLAQDAFVHDITTGVTERISLSTAGVEGVNATNDAAISGNGRYVAFESSSPEFVVNDTNVVSDIFVRDRQTGITTRVSVGPAGVEATGGSWGPSLSEDGRYVAFTSFATNLVSGAVRGTLACYVHDQVSGLTTLVSVDSNGVPANSICEDAQISADGRHVTFSGMASNLVTGDTNKTRDIFVHDRLLARTTRVSVDSLGVEGDGFSALPSISGDGQIVAFDSKATNLVSDMNGVTDVFAHDRAINGGGPSCGGGGSTNPCPCGNVAAEGQGCSNSSSYGATLGVYGSVSTASDDLVFIAEQMPPNKTAVLFTSSSLLGTGTGVAIGDGLLCLGGSPVSLGTRFSDGVGLADWGPGMSAAHGWNPGETWHFQVFYRDVANSPCGTGFNMTPAQSLTLN